MARALIVGGRAFAPSPLADPRKADGRARPQITGEQRRLLKQILQQRKRELLKHTRDRQIIPTAFEPAYAGQRQCEGVYKKQSLRAGQQCMRAAEPDSAYCIQHERAAKSAGELPQCAAFTGVFARKPDGRCSNRAKLGQEYCGVHLRTDYTQSVRMQNFKNPSPQSGQQVARAEAA